MVPAAMSSTAELLSPAGDFETALAAFEAGADAVYCGLSDFSARAFAVNFSEEQLRDLIRYARFHGKRVYVTFNTLIDEEKLEEAVRRLARLAEIGPDAIIVQDLGVARLARKYFPELELHASTQLVAHNLEGVLALRDCGFKRVVLARELSFAEIESIKKRCGDVELEVFIHGALCYSISGLCLYGAMEKGRSGNRGKCPYCCRQKIEENYPFSMKDLRLGEEVRKLAQLGVASLKIEGRMKSPLYVASVTRWYRQHLGESEKGKAKGEKARTVTVSDLETVFSRRTTELRFKGEEVSPIDSESLGHRGTPIGTVKRITKDREGRAWLRFHTLRALEKHDGLQFDALTGEGRHFGFGITEMRSAISRVPVFEVVAGADVEVRLPECENSKIPYPIHAGDTVYCSMSNAVKRAFPAPSFRRSDYPGDKPLTVEVTLEATRMTAKATLGKDGGLAASAAIDCALAAAKSPEKTFGAVEKAFSKLGETDYRLEHLTLVDDGKLFAPASVLNDLRRDLIEALDREREQSLSRRIDEALNSPVPEFEDNKRTTTSSTTAVQPSTSNLQPVLKLRLDQPVPAGNWSEIVVAITPGEIAALDTPPTPTTFFAERGLCRLALPVWNGELEFNKLRNCVKGLLRAGFTKWECSDLATLRMLKQLGVTDLTVDWTLYAFNSAALAELAELGVKRFTASPENGQENLAYLAESGYPVEFLTQQSTPLFISLHRPAAATPPDLAVYERGGLWITVKNVPRTFAAPEGALTRVDLSWDA